MAAAAWAAPPDRAPHMVSVVRPDIRSGKLVRSMEVHAKPVSEQRITPKAVEPIALPSTAVPVLSDSRMPANLDDFVVESRD